METEVLSAAIHKVIGHLLPPNGLDQSAVEEIARMYEECMYVEWLYARKSVEDTDGVSAWLYDDVAD